MESSYTHTDEEITCRRLGGNLVTVTQLGWEMIAFSLIS